MKKKTLLNFLMVLIILLIGFSGFMAVKNIKGGSKEVTETIVAEAVTEGQLEKTENSEETKTVIPLYVHEKTGIVTVERKGIAYEVDELSVVRTGDIYQTKVGSEISFAENSKNVVTLGANTTVKITDAETLAMELVEGEIFADHRNTEKAMAITAEGTTFTPIGTTYAVTAYKSAATVYVYSGKISATSDKMAESVIAEEGNAINVVTKENGDVTAHSANFSVTGINDWQISKLQKCEIDETFYFEQADLTKVVDNRVAEKAAAQQAQILLEQQAKDELANEQKEYDEAYQQYLENSENGAKTEVDEDGNIDVTAPTKYITLEIRCDTILNNMGDLTPGKEGYVPSSGTILAKTKISFTDGESAFDVLKRACKLAGIQIEYSWTPMYNSYYVEGINNLYEFDCGAESGWMYKVNGWFPNYGSSSYILEDGDVMVWTYTCKGLGADVGGSVYG